MMKPVSSILDFPIFSFRSRLFSALSLWYEYTCGGPEIESEREEEDDGKDEEVIEKNIPKRRTNQRAKNEQRTVLKSASVDGSWMCIAARKENLNALRTHSHVCIYQDLTGCSVEMHVIEDELVFILLWHRSSFLLYANSCENDD